MPPTRPLRPTDPREAGGFRLTARIGEGSQGRVYLGESAGGQRVAVKLLHADFGSDARARAAFERELAAARRVAPFCTAPILAAEADADPAYIVSEYIEGPSLRDLVAERGAVSGPELDRLAIGTATALAAIHEAGVVHRDFKPGNVLLGEDGPKVIDFGIARPLDATSATMTGAVGTPAYMAPEQVAGSTGGAPLDMFAWGCTMAFAANGSPPFGSDTVPAIMQRILHGEPELGALAGDLRELVASCLAKDPADRATALQVLQRLLGAGAGADLLAEGTSAATVTSPAGAPPTPGPAGVPGAGAAGSAGAPATPGAPGAVGVPGTWPAGARPAPPNAAFPAFPPPVPPPPGHPYPAAPRRGGRPLLIAGAVAAVVLMVAAGIAGAVLLRDGEEPATGAVGGGGGQVTRSSPAGTAAECAYEPAKGDIKDVGTPPSAPASRPARATIEANVGTLVLELDAAKAPCAVNSLAFLAGRDFYDSTSCHRLTSDPTLKVLQCGDPSGTGTGGPGYQFANENTDGARYTRGTVAMANAGPDTNGSQFFILYDDAPNLPGSYPVIGRVTSGMDVVDKVAEAGTDNGSPDGEPKQKVTIADVRMG
ncbi:protein kinase domain-containing protein [Actinomadura welshii]